MTMFCSQLCQKVKSQMILSCSLFHDENLPLFFPGETACLSVIKKDSCSAENHFADKLQRGVKSTDGFWVSSHQKLLQYNLCVMLFCACAKTVLTNHVQ